ncbi:hypothetical protein ACJONO_04885, partial [Mycoplasmopsis synoviae]
PDSMNLLALASATVAFDFPDVSVDEVNSSDFIHDSTWRNFSHDLPSFQFRSFAFSFKASTA